MYKQNNPIKKKGGGGVWVLTQLLPSWRNIGHLVLLRLRYRATSWTSYIRASIREQYSLKPQVSLVSRVSCGRKKPGHLFLVFGMFLFT